MTLHTVTVTVTPSTVTEPIEEIGSLPLGSATVVQGSSGFTWTVDPYHLEHVMLADQDQVEWVAVWEGCEAEPEVQVHPKGPWPFTGPPHKGPPANPSRAHADDLQGPTGHYEYGIIVKCQGQGTIVIDPDMDVE